MHTLFAFAPSDQDLVTIQNAAASMGIPYRCYQGGIDDVMTAAKTHAWAVWPTILVIDVRDQEDPVAAIKALTEIGPEDHAVHLIVIGAHNDIRISQRLESLGVSKYLLWPYYVDELTNALNSIINDGRHDAETMNPLKITCVTSSRAGVGSSTFACAMAATVARRTGKRVLLLDLDLEAGVQALAMDQSETPGFVDLLLDPSRIDAHLLNTVVKRSETQPNLIFLSIDGLPASIDPAQIRVREAVAKLAQFFDAVIIDLPWRYHAARQFVNLCSHVVYLMPPTVVGLRDAARFVESYGRTLGDVLTIAVSDPMRYETAGFPISEIEHRFERHTVRLPYSQIVTKAWLEESKSLDRDWANTDAYGEAVIKVTNRLPICKSAKSEEIKSGGVLSGLMKWLSGE